MEEFGSLNPVKKRRGRISLKIWRVILWGRGELGLGTSIWESLVKIFEKHSSPRNPLFMDSIGSSKHLCKNQKGRERGIIPLKV